MVSGLGSAMRYFVSYPSNETKSMVKSFQRFSIYRLRGMGLGYVELFLDTAIPIQANAPSTLVGFMWSLGY